MNGFARIGVPAFAMALASMLLQAHAALPPDPGVEPIPQELPPAPAIKPADNIIVAAPVVILRNIVGSSDFPIPLDQIDRVLPVVNQGFASDQPTDGSIEPLIQALHSESYRVRERASHGLLCLPPNRLQDITAALAVETDAEAISRLQVAAGHLFLKPRTNVHADAGFLGVGAGTAYVSMLGMKFDDPEKVNFGEGQDMVGVRVRELQPGFPAAQELRNGDVITAIAGRRFPEEMIPALVGNSDLSGEDSFVATSTNDSRRLAANSMFQSRIRALLPGSIVMFTVVRDGKLLDQQVQLTAMKSADGVSLTSLVDLRNRCMADFVAALKTGLQGAVQGMSARADTSWDRR